ncbi:NPP1 family protein [Streptomyces sp. DSM 42041]|uniref:NPP1 family protein n=1 Tax=Streptomyces hazeniae TaxID=3075538 RepID=A0ABU2NWB7_9ACTN|nr:NPP1 family protein [Streptomyces sp. DSM 42041]MDT0381283.1 NPP1 family protein [Streptomyces sp. DSM 42041]
MREQRPGRRRWFGRLSVTAGSVAALLLATSGVAFAAPPPALAGNAPAADRSYQPALDYDGDGCYPTPAIGSNGVIAPGLDLGGAVNGNCRDAWDLDNTNAYSRTACNNGWCAYLYALYFEKDQALPGTGIGGHRHDWEHVVVWVPDGGAPQYVSASAHGDYQIRSRGDVAWEGATHPKIVYHKDGISTHAFRFAGFDEQPENHKGAWQYPPLVGWDGYPSDFRDRLTQADFGSAQLGIRDSSFAHELSKAKPDGIPFDPQG